MASSIHLIERLGLIRPVAGSAGEFESGFWAVAEETAADLVGGDIYFHKKRAEPSFFGGRILGFRRQIEGEYVGRIIFRFRSEMDHEGVVTEREGWGMEKKIVGLLNRVWKEVRG